MEGARHADILSVRVCEREAPAAKGAVRQPLLVRCAMHIVHPDTANTTSKVRAAIDARRGNVAELSAHDVRTLEHEAIIRDCAPFTVVHDLNSSLTRPRATDKPHRAVAQWRHRG